MKAYLAVTGILFAVVFVLHIWEVVDRQQIGRASCRERV